MQHGLTININGRTAITNNALFIFSANLII